MKYCDTKSSFKLTGTCTFPVRGDSVQSAFITLPNESDWWHLFAVQVLWELVSGFLSMYNSIANWHDRNLCNYIIMCTALFQASHCMDNFTTDWFHNIILEVINRTTIRNLNRLKYQPLKFFTNVSATLSSRTTKQ